MNREISIDELNRIIKVRFQRLKDFGMKYKFSSQDGILKDRLINFFCFDNPDQKRKIEIVYCNKEIQSLHAYLINYKYSEPDYSDYENYISFNRLRFLLNADDVIFFGSEQYDINYRINEYDKIINKVKNHLTSEQWINFDELEKKAKESTAYAQFQISPKDWIKVLVVKFEKHKTFEIIYNPIGKPPYEQQNLCVKNEHNDIFMIGYGHFSRYDSGYGVHVMKGNKCIQSKIIYDAINMDYNLIRYCKKKVTIN